MDRSVSVQVLKGCHEPLDQVCPTFKSFNHSMFEPWHWVPYRAK